MTLQAILTELDHIREMELSRTGQEPVYKMADVREMIFSIYKNRKNSEQRKRLKKAKREHLNE